jgi:hypothetical protein
VKEDLVNVTRQFLADLCAEVGEPCPVVSDEMIREALMDSSPARERQRSCANCGFIPENPAPPPAVCDHCGQMFYGAPLKFSTEPKKRHPGTAKMRDYLARLWHASGRPDELVLDDHEISAALTGANEEPTDAG